MTRITEPLPVWLVRPLPNACCSGLAAPLIVFGCSRDGILFTSQSTEPVQLVFLLARIARVAGNRSIQDKLIRATSASEIVDLISQDDLASDTFAASEIDA